MGCWGTGALSSLTLSSVPLTLGRVTTAPPQPPLPFPDQTKNPPRPIQAGPPTTLCQRGVALAGEGEPGPNALM